MQPRDDSILARTFSSYKYRCQAHLLSIAFFALSTLMAAAFCITLPSPRSNIAGSQTRSIIPSQGLFSSATGNVCTRKHHQLVEKIKSLLQANDDPLKCAVIIDSLHRLGIDYHFTHEIKHVLPHMRRNLSDEEFSSCLFYVSLCFRLLRQHHYYVSPNVFNSFKDKGGKFKPQLSEDIMGMMALYEASCVKFEGRDILEEAGEFSSMHLRALVPTIEPGLNRDVEFTLHNPFFMSIPRFNIKHYLKTEAGGDIHIHELAKLDFDFVQSMHQREIEELAGWWTELGLQQEKKFARQNVFEWFIWAMIAFPEPQHSMFRVEIAKVISFVFLIDDIFDIYGTDDELVLFTQAVERWETNTTDQLPKFMRTCFLTLYNTTNSIANMVLNEHGWNPQATLRRTWEAMCRAFLAERSWITSGNLPKPEDYLSNGVISSGVPMALTHIFVLLGEGKEEESRDLADNPPALISCSALIFRLWNDIRYVKDNKERGQDGSYVECYTKKRGGDESCPLEEAEHHVMEMIETAWKKLNKSSISSSYSQAFTTASLNIARMAQLVYSYDNDQRSTALKELVDSVLRESIP